MTAFNGRTILVTGASGGIGGATVRQLVAAGADVIASGRSEAVLDTLAQATGCRTLAFDLTKEEEVRDALEGLDLWGVVNLVTELLHLALDAGVEPDLGVGLARRHRTRPLSRGCEGVLRGLGRVGVLVEVETFELQARAGGGGAVGRGGGRHRGRARREAGLDAGHQLGEERGELFGRQLSVTVAVDSAHQGTRHLLDGRSRLDRIHAATLLGTGTVPGTAGQGASRVPRRLPAGNPGFSRAGLARGVAQPTGWIYSQLPISIPTGTVWALGIGKSGVSTMAA